MQYTLVPLGVVIIFILVFTAIIMMKRQGRLSCKKGLLTGLNSGRWNRFYASTDLYTDNKILYAVTLYTDSILLL